MDYNLKINYLKKGMLLYELKVRGMPADDSMTVDSLRAALRPLLQLEKHNRALQYPPYNLDFEEEKAYVRDALNKIQSCIKSLTGENAKNKFERNQTHLVHLLNRVDRVPVDKLSPENVDARAALLVEILSTLDGLDQTSRKDPSLSALLGISSANHGVESDKEEVDSDSSSVCSMKAPCVSTPHQKSSSGTNYQRVEKWGIKFSGDPRGISVHGFLERVSELRIARHVSEKDLFESAIDLFEGKALNWFRSNRSRVSDWRGLTSLLIRHFEPPDYRSRLFKEILERTQDPAESIVDYLSSMHALFRRYGGMTDDVKLNIIIRNLAPFYTTQLSVVNSLEELEEQCLALESKKYRAEHYVPPSRKRHGFVEPDFAFVSDLGEALPRSESVGISEVGKFDSRGTRLGSRVFVCWNCQKEGHLSRDCPNPKKTHCFRCGAPNVTVRSCFKCRNSENAPRGNQ